MAKAQICLCFIIFLYISSEGNFMRVNAQSQGHWCVAKPGTDNDQLNKNINILCSKVDCKVILKVGACYTPDKLINQASVVMNLYYQDQGRQYWSCNFTGSGVIGITDPSYGGCYKFRK